MEPTTSAGIWLVLAFVYVAYGVPLHTQGRRATFGYHSATIRHRCSSKQVAARMAPRIFVLLLETRYQTLAHLVTTIKDHLLAIRKYIETATLYRDKYFAQCNVRNVGFDDLTKHYIIIT